MTSIWILVCFPFFFFNDTATTEIYTLSLHDALPISDGDLICDADDDCPFVPNPGQEDLEGRSEEHTSELQSRLHLVCRLLLEKKKEDNLRRRVDAQGPSRSECCVGAMRA